MSNSSEVWEPEPMAWSDLVGRLAGEMGGLDRDLASVETALGALANGTTDHNHLHNLQAVDLVRQKTAALALFLDEISQTIPIGWEVDADEAASRITLSDLAGRLLGKDFTEETPEPAGELDLF
ncbi:hypothetical protein NGM99_14835 [Mesorhizobium sp. RP14(2022)]|uniref:Uncharacterized protein n=1 Tax=Mesorhizobium liriopis TaxID=2953882 RepID=A0ABT1C893_9HYPH|nr:hypothetical protein [Mesorhizobium liriopis]MCO6051057.1 hypothetical protein [Mesorhizobium liriopis]